jgi:transposase
VKRVQGVWERATRKLASVASDIRGVSGRAMRDALSAGRADPPTRAAGAKRRRRRQRPLRAPALTGLVRDQHRRL